MVVRVGGRVGWWVRYIEGGWVGNRGRVEKWVCDLGGDYDEGGEDVFDKEGLWGVLIGGFIGFVRRVVGRIGGL